MLDFNKVEENCAKFRAQISELYEEFLRCPTGYNRLQADRSAGLYLAYLDGLCFQAQEERDAAQSNLDLFLKRFQGVASFPEEAIVEQQETFGELLRAVRQADMQLAQTGLLRSPPASRSEQPLPGAANSQTT